MAMDLPAGHVPRGTQGVIQEVVNDQEGKHLELHLELDGRHQVVLGVEDFRKVKVQYPAEHNLRLALGVLLILGLFLWLGGAEGGLRRPCFASVILFFEGSLKGNIGKCHTSHAK